MKVQEEEMMEVKGLFMRTSLIVAAVAGALTANAWAQQGPVKIGLLATLEGPFGPAAPMACAVPNLQSGSAAA